MSDAERVALSSPNSGWIVDEWMPQAWRTGGR
jgi:hypothetical protein